MKLAALACMVAACGGSLLDSGHAYRGASIGMAIGGVLLVAAGTYLFLTPHRDEPRISLQLDRTTAGGAYTVRF